MQNTNLFIITTQPGAADTAVGELQRIDPGVRTEKVFSPEARMLRGASDAEGSEPLPVRFGGKRAPIFTRHMFPVHYTGAVASPEWTSILPSAFHGESSSSSFELSDAIESSGAFSVQLRVIPWNAEAFEKGKEIIAQAEDELTRRGYTRNDKNPEWVLSLLINEDTLYAGVSRSRDNLSRWSGGEARFKKDAGFISRAEFKLLEAFDVFGPDAFGLDTVGFNEFGLDTFGPDAPGGSDTIRGMKTALDLGAAPGGWTKILLEAGFRVTAVDPADMHPSLTGHPRLTHIKKAAQHCAFDDASFGLLVNDMRMDIFDSARIMLSSARLLRPGAPALMTLKLPQGHWLQKTGSVLKLLEEKYKIINARQLFHNRNEVTVGLRALFSGTSARRN